MKRFLLLLLAIGGFTVAFSQTGTIKGFVFDKSNGEPVIFTNVYLLKTTHGSATDENGYFIITKVPAGDYTLIVTYLGYDTLTMPISLQSGGVITKQLYLNPAAINLETINISAEYQEARTETKTSVVKITPKDIGLIPSIGGQPDLAQYLQVMPGVVFTGDQGGELYIRGGSPIQNKVLLDGVTIYKAFHSIGLFSVFETDIIRSADIYTGGFGAEYGGRISSVMDITTRDGNRTRFAGKVGLSSFGANLLLEGPFVKIKENRSGSAGFILSAKGSYLEQSSELLYKYIDTAGLPFNFLDLYGKVSIQASNGSKINFYGFHYRDQVNEYKTLSDFNWHSTGIGTNFLVIPGKSDFIMEGHVAYSNYTIGLIEETSPERTSRISGFDVGLDFTYFLGKDELKFGLEQVGSTTDYYFVNGSGMVIEQQENTTEIGLFAKYKLTAGKFLIEPSFRLQWYASLSTVSPEPRLALKYNVTKHFRLKFAGGLYSQNLISARSDRDVVNLFYAILSGPDNLPDYFDGKPVTHALQKATHLILGGEFDIASKVTMNIEGYYKIFNQLTNLNRNKIYDEDKNPEKPALLKEDFILEKGDAYGLDLTLKYDRRSFYFWVVYSYAFVNRFYEEIDTVMQQYYPHFDRRHNVNLVTTYRFGKQYGWEFSARWNYGSGFPFTQTQGYFEKIKFEDGIYSDYITDNGELAIIYGDLNKGRLPSYHRLDLNMKKRFFLSEHSKIDVDVSVVNVYNRKNVFYRDRLTGEIVYQLPVMPSLGITWTF
ncbi:MAG TPA: TonB-dependent receptor [Bacteroidales bacterium]|nr:TonB-dependent receptor [Bacteroidales bacterium]